MFFPDRIRSIRRGDLVLEVGPGGTPHPRSDVFLDRRFEDEQAAAGQRGHAPPLKSDKPLVHYDGGRFPFADREFGYVICSQVLEHVADVDAFVAELTRVASRGYVEFPTVYYDYLYDFPEHSTLVLRRSDIVYWMPKRETSLAMFRPVTGFFYQSLAAGRTSLVDELKPWLFQGFEWRDQIRTQRTSNLSDVCYALEGSDALKLPRAGARRRRWTRWLKFKRPAA